MAFFFTGIGMVLLFEGVIYALFPSQTKQFMGMMQKYPVENLRVAGLVAAVAGFCLLYFVKFPTIG